MAVGGRRKYETGAILERTVHNGCVHREVRADVTVALDGQESVTTVREGGGSRLLA